MTLDQQQNVAPCSLVSGTHSKQMHLLVLCVRMLHGCWNTWTAAERSSSDIVKSACPGLCFQVGRSVQCSDLHTALRCMLKPSRINLWCIKHIACHTQCTLHCHQLKLYKKQNECLQLIIATNLGKTILQFTRRVHQGLHGYS